VRLGTSNGIGQGNCDAATIGVRHDARGGGPRRMHHGARARRGTNGSGESRPPTAPLTSRSTRSTSPRRRRCSLERSRTSTASRSRSARTDLP
jgi:hypothetical protein